MKNRCLAIFFVVMTLAVSPQVWQKLGNLLDAIQHRAQIKFLSMVLSPREGSEADSAASTVQSQHFVPCQHSSFVQAQNEPQTKSVSSLHKSQAGRRGADRAEKQEALAFSYQAKDAQGESLSHLNNPVRELPNVWAMRVATFAPREIATEKSKVAEAIALPQLETVAPVFIQNVNLQLKFKKILDENKLTRQRTRCPLSKTVPPLPSS